MRCRSVLAPGHRSRHAGVVRRRSAELRLGGLPTVGLAERLRDLDERIVWVDAPKPKFTPMTALLLGLLAVGVYVGWALVWPWPLALLGVLALVAGLAAIARFWFAPTPSSGAHALNAVNPGGQGLLLHDRRGTRGGSDAERRPRVSGGRVGHDVDEVRRPGVEAAT
ncbi:MAG: hypothetical protein JO079_06255 [Frankiaceae bacterium]|nr:hypothetical protein [Frankiaceae bacterium]